MTSPAALGGRLPCGGPTLSAALPYRPDIDGLRAVAVLAVVLFHAKLGAISGGYVGVDIFFVISGYLITSIVVREIGEGTFSLADFYERRIRRIFPALFVVVFASLIAGWNILTPKDYTDLARSAMNTAIFTSNFAFNQTAGYFAPAAEAQPLLHTWSLAVEEQFYVIAPLALWFLYRLTSGWRALIFAILGLASLAWSAYGVSNEWSSAFYLLPSRAWELMLGMALAMRLFPSVGSRGLANILGGAGLAMIASAMLLFTDHTPFPGLAALLPCVGAAFVIHSATSVPTIMQRLLSASPMVAVGKISYSLYLWHWPLLAYATYEWGDEFGTRERLALIALAFVLSALTWAFVEQPARKRRADVTQRRVFITGGAAIALCLIAGLSITQTHGVVWRLSPAAQAFAASVPIKIRAKTFCKKDAANETHAESYCYIGDMQKAETSFVLWGDSHALAAGGAFSNVAEALGRRGAFVVTGGCPPLLGLEAFPGNRFTKCLGSASAVSKLLEQPSVRDVVIMARWALYAEGTGNAGETNVSVRRFVEADEKRNRSEFVRLLRETVAAIAATGRRVTLLASVPELPYNLPSAVIKDMMHGRTRDYSISRATFESRQAGVRGVLAELSTLPGVRVLYPDRILCDEKSCQTLENGAALYMDDDHLSPRGAEKLKSMLQEALTPATQ